MDYRQAQLGWVGKRLAYLLPSLAVAVLVLVFLLRRAGDRPPVLVPSLLMSVLLGAFIAYLIFQTFRAGKEREQAGLQESRALRRQLRASDTLAVASALLLGLLGALPEFFREEESKGQAWTSLAPLASVRASSIAARQEELPALPETATEPEAEPIAALESQAERPAPPSVPPRAPEAPGAPAALAPPAPAAPAALEAPRAPAALASPAAPAVPALPTKRGEPEIQPAIVLEPSHLEYSEKDLFDPQKIELPYIPSHAALVEAPPIQESAPLPSRPNWDDFNEHHPREDRFLFGLLVRPLPDERDLEGWPDPELRVQGFLLLGGDRGRVPGFETALDLPFGRCDSVQATWMAARMPVPKGEDVHDTPNWDHLTLAYVRRLTGYTSHATFDLAVAVGVNTDFFKSVEGIPDSGTGPKFAPYIAFDASFWQYEVVGLILHVGESIPTTVFGSSMGVTDFRADIRWDLSARVSVRAGYQVLVLKYKSDEVARLPGTELLKGTLSGPAVALDFRF